MYTVEGGFSMAEGKAQIASLEGMKKKEQKKVLKRIDRKSVV